LRRVKRKKQIILITQIAVLILFFAFWELAAEVGFISSQPSRIVNTIVSLYRNGELFHHVIVTCVETVLGFVLGTLIGILIAIILWWSEFYLVVLNSLPKIALGPIFIVWIGAGPAAIVVIAILNGFLGVDGDKIKLVKTFGANKVQILTKSPVFAAGYGKCPESKCRAFMGWSYCGRIFGFKSRAGLPDCLRRTGVPAGPCDGKCCYTCRSGISDVSGGGVV